MELMYADKMLNDCGIIMNYSLDLSVANSKDFQLDVSKEIIKKIERGYYVYIDGTEYGGIIDKIEVETANVGTETFRLSGRTWRQILNGYFIVPQGDYVTINGSVKAAFEKELERLDLNDFIKVDISEEIIADTKFSRYCSVYEGFKSILKGLGYNLRITLKSGSVILSAAEIGNISTELFTTDNSYKFNAEKSNGINHLICLGSGELSDRIVAHLYVDRSGNISTKRWFRGLEEWAEVYENVNCDDAATLIEEGTEKLQEKKGNEKITIGVDDYVLHIGDVVSGYEEVTKQSITAEVVDVLLKIEKHAIGEVVNIEYTIGGSEK